MVWNVIVVISKTLLFYIEMGLSQPIIELAVILIGWIQPYQTLELILVIIVVPVIMNGLAFWIQDNFLMKKELLPTRKLSDPITVDEDKKEMQTDATEEGRTVINEPLL